jgi:hypothetical protein
LFLAEYTKEEQLKFKYSLSHKSSLALLSLIDELANSKEEYALFARYCFLLLSIA